MSTIRLLEESVINKIAAGEVIERPASVVKELVENAIDAGATQITVEIDEGGKSRIKVIDNGHGMSSEDAQKCLQRHATSKIVSADDLFKINTLGFRGEGLASICAVAEMKLKTKLADQSTGYKIVASGGKIINAQEVAMPNGTSIEVTNLFFNVPARKKHLKTMQTELRKITELMTKIALAYPEITVKLVHHKQELLFAPATKNGLDNILNIYGKTVAYAMLPVEYTHGNITVGGFVAKPTLTRADKHLQHIFVNRRPIFNVVIGKAAHDAYHTLLHLERQPVFFLDVRIDPETIDVNVHPQKTTIRVEKEQEVYLAVFNAVKNALESRRLIPTVEEKPTTQAAFRTNFKVTEEKQTFFTQEKEMPSHTLEVDNPSVVTASLSPQQLLERAMDRMHHAQEESTVAQSEEVVEDSKESLITTTAPKVEGNEKISTLKLVGCIHDVFYLAENELGLVVIDQHAAHERVMYEKFMKQMQENAIAIQELLSPEQIEFSPTEMLIIGEHTETLKRLGFAFEPFGGNTMLLRTVPTIFSKHVPTEVVHDILQQLGNKSTSLDEMKEEKIIRSACRAAVKANDVVHKHEMGSILEELQQCVQPFTCPHGRPTMIQFSIPELEKKFKRVV